MYTRNNLLDLDLEVDDNQISSSDVEMHENFEDSQELMIVLGYTPAQSPKQQDLNLDAN